MRNKQTIEEAAKAAMTPQNEINCSGYVRTVALDLGEYMPQMDSERDGEYLAKNPSWEQLDNNGQMASQLRQGYLVIAGTQSHGHGHVVMIVPGRAGQYARGYWGSLGKAHEGEGKWHRLSLDAPRFA